MKQEKARKQDLLSILAVALVAFAGILSETSMNVTFPHLSQVFGLGLGVLQWITTGYLLAVAITITLGATLAHNWTERHRRPFVRPGDIFVAGYQKGLQQKSCHSLG